MATNYPLLFFPEPIPLQKESGKPFVPKAVHYPSNERQKDRLTPLFDTLRSSFDAQRMDIQQTPIGVDPEQVIVFETIGTVDNFVTAVKHTDGLEWLDEIEMEDILPSTDFYFVEKKEKDKNLSGRLFLTMSNQKAMNEILSLWQRFTNEDDFKFPRGLSGFKSLFKQLKDVRRWDIQDRLTETNVIEYWLKDIQENEEIIRFELQLWFHKNPKKQESAFQNISSLVGALNGRCLSHAIIEEISYHGILVELPAAAIQQIIAEPNTQLVKCNDIMFFRPSGQIAVRTDVDTSEFIDNDISKEGFPSGDPEAALLDGAPVENHQTLIDRIIVDDPDEFIDNYAVQYRVHGTAMSSLIINGDLNNGESTISSPLYIRPIMKPVIGFNGTSFERVPNDVLFVDLLHRAVKRIFEGDRDNEPLKSIKIINLSIGDDSLLFYQSMTPTAKLLDWLSWKYKVLFVISSGNHIQDLDIPVRYRDFKLLSVNQKESLIYSAIINDKRNRRLLSPSESINNLTVGSLSLDNSTPRNYDNRINPTQQLLPNIHSAFGGGYRRSIKPDIVYFGGAQYFEEPILENSPTVLRYSCNYGSPGNLVAAPSNDLNKIHHTRGTSNATALLTRRGIQITDTLKELFQEAYFSTQYRQFLPLIIKTLLTHGCSWGEVEGNLINVLNGQFTNSEIKKIITNWIGYGTPDVRKVQECTDNRVTVLGFGELQQDKVHLFKFPLPPSLSSRPESRRLTITLSWFTPIATNSQKYRVASLFFDSEADMLGVSRDDADWQKVKKGTLQHEVFVGQKAVAFEDDGAISIRVVCKKDAIDFNYSIPYSLAVSLEVAEEINIPVYQEVREKLLTPIIIEQNI